MPDDTNFLDGLNQPLRADADRDLLQHSLDHVEKLLQRLEYSAPPPAPYVPGWTDTVEASAGNETHRIAEQLVASAKEQAEIVARAWAIAQHELRRMESAELPPALANARVAEHRSQSRVALVTAIDTIRNALRHLDRLSHAISSTSAELGAAAATLDTVLETTPSPAERQAEPETLAFQTGAAANGHANGADRHLASGPDDGGRS
jgi:hypothetical protein